MEAEALNSSNADVKEDKNIPEPEHQSIEYQRTQWASLNNAIVLNLRKLNKENIKSTILSLFKLNINRGRGLFTRNIIRFQEISLDSSELYASLAAVINSKIPAIGKLLIQRLVIKYQMTFKRSNREGCRASLLFISYLTKFEVCDTLLTFQILVQLLENPSDFNVQMVHEILNILGKFLLDQSNSSVDRIYERLKNLLSEGLVSSEGQKLIQKCFQMRKLDFKTCNEIDTELDLVEDEDKITHKIRLNDDLDSCDILDAFHYEADYQKNEEEFLNLKKEIIGNDDDDDDDDAAHSDSNSSDLSASEGKFADEVKDFTESNLLDYQKKVYLTIMSSMGPEEATHKLLKLPSIDDKKKEFMLVDMVLKCCAQEKSYSKYYGLIGEGLIIINDQWRDAFDQAFIETYENCHKFETTLLRNIGKFWGHMFASDKMGWEVLKHVKLTEEDTTSSGRIFLKFLFQRILEELGLNAIIQRLNEDYIQEYLVGIFPYEDAEHLRFSINFFTAIGLGKLTDRMRSSLKSLPPDIEQIEERGRSRSPNRSSSRANSYSRSRSASDSYSRSRSSSFSRSPSPTRRNMEENDYRDRLPTGPRSRQNMERYGNNRYSASFRGKGNDRVAVSGSYRGRSKGYRGRGGRGGGRGYERDHGRNR